MQNMSDTELDDLFKEAAEGFKPPQDSSAWNQMAARLDQAAPVSGFWNWKTISAVSVTGILFITATWYAVAPQKELRTLSDTQYESNNATSGVVQEQKEQTHNARKENLTPAQSLESKSDGNDAVDVTAGNSNNTLRATTNANRKNFRTVNETTDRKIKTVKPKPVLIDEKNQTNLPAETTPIQEKEHPSLETSTAQHQTTSLTESKSIVVRDSIQTAGADIKTDSAQNSDPAGRKNEKKKLKSRSGFSVKLAVSPDFSSVNFFSAGKPGINVGLLAGYSFNSRWSMYTGVISSKKLYTSKDIKKSYSWDGHDYPVKELDGDCRIIDIPVNVYYSFFPERSFSLKVGLGLSSYLMRKETYNYCVDNYGTNVFYEQRINGENNEWFKILNFSVIAEKKLTNRLSAEFEPFVKAPLAGVGEGKVSLVSMGAFINLKFDLSNNN
jgi:Outer membrane protein beta-barrel domain